MDKLLKNSNEVIVQAGTDCIILIHILKSLVRMHIKNKKIIIYDNFENSKKFNIFFKNICDTDYPICNISFQKEVPSNISLLIVESDNLSFIYKDYLPKFKPKVLENGCAIINGTPFWKNKQSVTLDIVIPSYINDCKYIIPCLENLSLQTCLPDNAIVCVSSIDQKIGNQIRQEIGKLSLPFNVVVLDTFIRQNAAQNRNRGIKYCKENTFPDYIMFVDCDDITHTRKIEYFKKIIKLRKEINLLCHKYVYHYEELDIHSNYGNPTLEELEMCRNSKTTVNMETDSEHWKRLHHGHVIIKSEVCYDIHYREEKNMEFGEDSILCQDINKKYGNIYLYTKPLVKYFYDPKKLK